MIDPVSAALTAALFGSGWLAGRFARLRRTPKIVQVKPICLCGHHYGTHDPETGACGTQYTVSVTPKFGGYAYDTWVECACVRYTGPQPVEQYWVPPAADLSIVTAPRPLEDHRDH